MSVSLIHEMVLRGRITPAQGASLLALRRHVARARARRAFWRWLRRVLTLGMWR